METLRALKVKGASMKIRQRSSRECLTTGPGSLLGSLDAIRNRIDHSHATDVVNDSDAAAKLAQLKQQIAGLTGQDLAKQPPHCRGLRQVWARGAFRPGHEPDVRGEHQGGQTDPQFRGHG